MPFIARRVARRLAALLMPLPFLVSAPGVAAESGRGDRLAGLPFAGRSPVIAPHGMAATSQPLATMIAVDVLKRGGGAVDAAIAADAALGLMEPTGAGVGGDLFAIIWDPKTRKLYGYNGSGRSPQAQTLAMVRAKAVHGVIPGFGAVAVSTPGAVDGWFALHDRFGKLPIADLLAPAIGYAADGFPLSPTIAAGWGRNVAALEKRQDQIEELDNARRTYTIDGKPPEAGQRFRNPDLAETYRLIAAGGRAAFYSGPIAERIDSYMRRIGGALSKADLAQHHGEWVAPITTSYRGFEVAELPPNSQGLAAIEMLNIMERFDLAKMGHNSADALHVMIEAKKLAFADRARYYADPALAEVPVAALMTKPYAAERAKLIRMDRAMDLPEAGAPSPVGDTVYLATADADGMMVSFIQSNYRGMGGGLVPDGLGFMLQDRGALFSLADGHPNQYAPGKRPFQTIIPGFVLKEGEPYLAFGVMGGAMQPQGHVQVLSNLIDFGMNVQEAGDAARFIHNGGDEVDEPPGGRRNQVNLESGVAAETVAELVRRGHAAQIGRDFYGGYQAVMWDRANRVYWGASEMRFDGAAMGY